MSVPRFSVECQARLKPLLRLSLAAHVCPQVFPLFFTLMAVAVVILTAYPSAFSQDTPVASTESVVASGELPKPAEILARAQAAMAEAGIIKAEMTLEVTYPAQYTSTISLYANAAGDERAKIKTTIRTNTVKALEVITGGVLYAEQSTPGGIVVSRIDLNEVKKRLAASDESFAAIPALGANALFELGALSAIVDFSGVTLDETGGKALYVLTGKLSSKFSEGGARLPPGAARFYRSAKVSIDRESLLPVSIELGDNGGKPLLKLSFTSIEKGVELPEGTFSYTVPAEAEVMDRTEWAIAELGGK